MHVLKSEISVLLHSPHGQTEEDPTRQPSHDQQRFDAVSIDAIDTTTTPTLPRANVATSATASSTEFEAAAADAAATAGFNDAHQFALPARIGGQHTPIGTMQLPPAPAGLSEQQLKRRHIVAAIIHSENSYVATLQRLVNVSVCKETHAGSQKYYMASYTIIPILS